MMVLSRTLLQATGIEILHDDSANPLKDMDGWLSQVAAMDAVSVSPTQCMVPAASASLQCALSAIKAIGDGLILRFTKVVTGTHQWMPATKLKQRLEASLMETVTGYKNVSKIDRRLALSPSLQTLSTTYCDVNQFSEQSNSTFEQDNSNKFLIRST